MPSRQNLIQQDQRQRDLPDKRAGAPATNPWCPWQIDLLLRPPSGLGPVEVSNLNAKEIFTLGGRPPLFCLYIHLEGRNVGHMSCANGYTVSSSIRFWARERSPSGQFHIRATPCPLADLRETVFVLSDRYFAGVSLDNLPLRSCAKLTDVQSIGQFTIIHLPRGAVL